MTDASGRRASRPHYGRGWRIHQSGYVDIWAPAHPLARSDGYVFEHRMVAWDAGLLTDPVLQVHHRNKDKQDNRLSNLEVLTAEEHQAEHHPVGGLVRNQYGVSVVKPPQERRNVPKPERSCEGCGDVISAAMRRDARYCSEPCRVRTWKRARRAA